MRLGATAVGGLGLLLLIAGTFLPWLRSGQVTRNSYQTFGVLRRWIGESSPLGVALAAWPALGLLAAVSVALFALQLRRAAAITALLLSLPTGTVAVAAIIQSGEGEAPIGVMTLGPSVTLAGAVLIVVGAVASLRTSPNPPTTRSAPTRHSGGTTP